MQGKVFKQEVKDDIKQKQQLNGDCVRTVCPSTYLGVCFTNECCLLLWMLEVEAQDNYTHHVKNNL